MESIPTNWILVEEWDNNYIFENSNRSFGVNVTFTEQLDFPHDIGFSQLKGDFNLIGYEDGAYMMFRVRLSMVGNTCIPHEEGTCCLNSPEDSGYMSAIKLLAAMAPNTSSPKV